MRPKLARLMPVLLPVALVVTGCSGINASKSVSPLDFLIPGGFMRGLIQNPPASTPIDDSVPATEPGHPVAQVN